LRRTAEGDGNGGRSPALRGSSACLLQAHDVWEEVQQAVQNLLLAVQPRQQRRGAVGVLRACSVLVRQNVLQRGQSREGPACRRSMVLCRQPTSEMLAPREQLVRCMPNCYADTKRNHAAATCPP
jgi:hypothetical protein